MRLFSRHDRRTLVRADEYSGVPVPNSNELLVVPLKNTLWHPDIAVFANNRKTPSWYKKVTSSDAGLRRCFAVGDYVRTGYTIPLWAAVGFRPPIDSSAKNWDARFLIEENPLFKVETFSNEEMLKYFSDTALQLHQFKYEQSGECPITKIRARPESNYAKLHNPWLFRTAPGYSTLFIPPMWEPNENYHAVAAVVNTDYYHHCNIVLNITSNKEFRIEEGTPLLHAIPFKRKDNIKGAKMIKGDSQMFELLEELGFNTVHKSSDWFGDYRKHQYQVDDKEVKDV